MKNLSELGPKELEQLIIQNVPLDALMALQDACVSGDQKCITYAMLFDKGHRSSGAGHNRHFFNNETFREALITHGATPLPLCGTRLVVGRLGIFNIARLNVPGHKWVKLKNSKSRQILAQDNALIEQAYVQSDFFYEERPVTKGTIFILSVMDGLDAATGIAKLTQVMIALPAPSMESWLYIKPLTEFLGLYDLLENNAQLDNAVPTLKVQPKKLTGNDQGN